MFKALADPTRRDLLDALFAQDGQTMTALEERVPMTRFGVMKHLKVLEGAGLVVTRKHGREKLHFLNPVPLRMQATRFAASSTSRCWVTPCRVMSRCSHNWLSVWPSFACNWSNSLRRLGSASALNSRSWSAKGLVIRFRYAR